MNPKQRARPAPKPAQRARRKVEHRGGVAHPRALGGAPIGRGKASSCPPITRRRPHDERWPEGYLEGDRDYVMNNVAAAVWLLDRAGGGGGGGGRKL